MPYKTISKIASGTFGTVYKVQDSTNNEFFALKLIHENYKNPKELKRIKRGFESAQKVSHPNCVKMIDWYENGKDVGFVMEFVETQEEDLTGFQKPVRSGNLTETISKIIQIANGLEALHSGGIVHRDLKPANILETKQGQIKITDFDLVKIDNASTMTASGDFLGTLKYSSPEQCNNSTKIDARSDLYSLGIMFYEMLTGVCPINGESLGEIALAHLRSPIISPRQIVSDLPAEIEKVVLKLLAKSPKDRFQSASELSRILNDFLKEGNFSEVGKTKAYLLPSIFVSRKEELKTLENAFTEASNGVCKNIFISGESGVGKTRLWEEFKLGLSSQNIFLLETKFAGTEISIEPLGKFISKGLDSISQISDKEKIEVIGKFAWDLVKIYPPLEQFSFMKKIEKIEELKGKEGEFRLFETLIKFLTKVSKQTTLIFHFEDIQWADELSAKLLLHLTRNLSQSSCLIVGSHRKIEAENSHFAKIKGEIVQDFSATEIELKPISVEEIVQMLTSIFGKSDPIETEFAEFVFEKTKGNPLFVKEIIFNLFDKNLLTDSNGNWNLDLEIISKVEIPNTVFSVLNQRLNLLDKETLEILQLASILGEEFGVEILSKVLSLSEEKIVANLEVSTILNFVEKGESNYRFVHGSIRETLQKNLDSELKKNLHKEVGEFLENKFSSDKTEVIEELANHFYFGNVQEKAINYSIEAAKILSKRFSNSKALGCLNNAIDFLKETERVEKLIDCKTQKVDILLLLGKIKDAKILCEETLALSQDFNDFERISKCYGTLAIIYFQLGKNEETIKTVQKAIKGNEKLGNENELLDNLQTLTNIFGRFGKAEEAFETIDKALKIAKKLKNKKKETGFNRSLATTLHTQGQNLEAIEILKGQIEVLKKLNDKNGLANTFEILGTIYQNIGNFEESRNCLIEFKRISEEAGNLKMATRALSKIAISFAINGQFEKALEFLFKALEVVKKMGDIYSMSSILGNIGAVNSDLGNYDEAIKYIKMHLNNSQKLNNKAGMGESNLILGQIYHKTGEFKKALNHLQIAQELFETLGNKEKLAQILLTKADILKEQNHYSESKICSDQLIEIAKKTGMQIFFEKAIINQLELCHLKNKIDETKPLIEEYEKLEKRNQANDVLVEKLKILFDFEEGLHESSISFFKEKLETEKDDSKKADSFYHLTKLGVKSYDSGTKILTLEEINSHKENAIQLYEKLFSNSPRFLYKSRIKELKSIVFHPQAVSPQLLKSLVKWMNPETVFSELLKFLSEECKANGCQIILKNTETEKFEVCAISPNLREDEIDFSSGILKEAIETKKPILIEDATHSEKFQSNKSILGKIFLSVIAVPLEIQGEICGALYLHRTKVKSGFFVTENLKQVIEISKILSPILIRQQEAVKLKMESEIRNFGIIGNSPKMHSLFEKIKMTVNVTFPIYIHGETGTGKELVSKALHQFSERKSKNFVVVNCATIPKDLAESELFGHEKGAFSGANSMKKGKFELSDGGTLFLDEIGELTLPLQSKLLRAIQEKEIWRVGGQKAIKIDLRIIVATHKDLEEEVKKGNFREDLYHRLNVVKLEIPPLRDRIEDIPILANYFLNRQSKELGKEVVGLTPESQALLQLQKWAGNVRELENTIAKGLVMKTNKLPLNSKELDLTANNVIQSSLPSTQPQKANSSEFEGLTFDEKIGNLEKKILVSELEKHNWNRSKTATSLKLTRDKLYRLLNKHNLLEK